MALTGKQVSLKNIIAKVYRDLGLKEEEDFINFIEWGAEALEQIGVFEQLETKTLCIPINFYKAELPCDLVYLNYVSYGNKNLQPSSSLTGPVMTEEDRSRDWTGLSLPDSILTNVNYIPSISSSSSARNSYSISGGYLNIGVEKGDVHINYQAMPVDEEGYPLVPDHVSFREAVYRYIVYKWLYPRYIRGEADARMIGDAEQKWLWYCGQAGAQAQMPSLGKMENMARRFISLRPNVYQFQSFFEDLNKSTV